MKPGDNDQPSPTQLAWLLVAAVRPSTDWEEYDRPRPGCRPPGTEGVSSP